MGSESSSWITYFATVAVAKQLMGPYDFLSFFSFFHAMEVNVFYQLFGCPHSAKHLLLCSSEERNSYRFATT